MGLISGILGFLFGNSRNVVAETAGVFRENAEAGAGRQLTLQTQAMEQFGAEFSVPREGVFDRFVDGLNRLPRPALAFGTLGLFVAAMIDPLWFAERMQGLALVPEPLWWLLGVIVSFYFGARHQAKTQDFQREIAGVAARVPQFARNIATIDRIRADDPGVADPGSDAAMTLSSVEAQENPALEEWRRRRGV